MSDGLWVTLMVTGIVLIIAALCAIGIGVDYYGACRRAELFNRMNNTTWTCGDFYWAGSQINNQTITVKP